VVIIVASKMSEKNQEIILLDNIIDICEEKYPTNKENCFNFITIADVNTYRYSYFIKCGFKLIAILRKNISKQHNLSAFISRLKEKTRPRKTEKKSAFLMRF
jgi:hypothetical protein